MTSPMTLGKTLWRLAAAAVLLGAGYWAGTRSARHGAAAGAAEPARRILYYRNPMDPSVHSPVPAKDGMGMDYVPVYSDELAPPATTVAGRAAVAITAERRQLLGIRSEAVVAQPLARSVRTVARVAVDERLIHHVHTKYDGY